MAPKRPRVSKSNSNTNHEISSSQTVFETVKGSHEYEIKGYSLTKGMGVGKSMNSGRFTVAGYDWVVRFYPDGLTTQAQEAEYVSVYVRLVSPGEVRASFEFKLRDQIGKGIPSRSSRSPHTFKFGSSSYSQWGYTKYMKKSQVETSDYLKDDCLSIRCTVGVVQTRGAKGNRYVIHVPPSDMPQNFKGLLESKIGFDITFQVGNEFFRAHKLILAARSPVFRAMFFGLVGNPEVEIVVIEEFNPFTFKAMLLFLYSDEFPEAHELFDSDSLCTSTTIARHLLVAADRYGLARLKLMCEEKLYEDITANTVADTLELADLHNCMGLKTACLNFVAKPENLGEVMKSDGYAYLKKCHPSLLTDLLKTIAMVDK
ncbi:BTB/POZ and MATH domain-containing protein 3-like [Papaver somniferum]|uniref:BTB/POZ and MATH domain-containing protein 3-like n=1 Tax=Papaver somniferum TaxID=3469 RepID=UPI000E6F64BF|nr:BTB/POZ and MATH domain-containing protein 3-like [Papaver somniferum]